MGQAVAPRDRLLEHEEPAGLDLELEPRHAVRLEAGLPFPRDAMKFPMVPRANDVVAIERAVSERTARMVAGAVDRSERAADARERDPRSTHEHLLERRPRELGDLAQIVPLTGGH